MRKLQATIRLCQIKFSYCYVGLSHEFSMMNKSPDDFETEHEWLTHCAEHGFTESMLKLSMQILTSRTDEKRVAEAYKWLFLARFLNDSKSEDPLLLLRSCLSDSQIQEGEALVDVWATQKQSEFNEDKTSDWAKDLLEMWIDSNRKSNIHWILLFASYFQTASSS